LEQVTNALRSDPAIYVADLSPPLRAHLGIRRSA
jgi:hypothetical protein